MDRNQREKQGTSEFQTRFVERDGGTFFELEQPGGPGTVSLSSGPHKSLEEAREAGAEIVRAILRRRIEESGIARRGEYPAFDEALYLRRRELLEAAGLEPPTCPGCGACAFPPSCPKCGCVFSRLASPGRRRWVAPKLTTYPLTYEADPMQAPALEGEQLCSCGDTDGIHILGENSCTREGCRCEEFEAADPVPSRNPYESVQ